ncbi:MAG: redoxin family protein, partial [Muribaculaceae bacterium]|nr:redoxin family protein [Muribaculaceae bacterium]
GIDNVTPASAFREEDFQRNYGVRLIDGPLKGLLARAVVIIARDGRIIYRELVNQITDEPDYAAALSVLK